MTPQAIPPSGAPQDAPGDPRTALSPIGAVDPFVCPATGRAHRFYGGPDSPAGCLDCPWGDAPAAGPEEPF